MKKVLYFVQVAILGLVIFTSCKNDNLETITPDASVSAKFDNSMLSDPTISSDYVVKNGTVHFKDLESFRKLAPNLPELALRLKNDYPQFESLQSLNEKALKSLEDIKSVEDIDKMIESNSKYIVKDGTKGKARTDGVIASILNGDGFYYIGKVLYFFNNNKGYIIKTGNIDELKNIRNGRVSGESLSEIEYKSRIIGNKGSKVSGNFIYGTAENAAYAIAVNCAGYFNVVFAGNDVNTGEAVYDAFGYVQVDGNPFRKINGWYYSFQTNSQLVVNYKATVLIFGNPTSVSQEPNFSISNNSSRILDNRFIGYRFLTQAEKNSNAASIDLESRNGSFSISQISTAAKY